MGALLAHMPVHDVHVVHPGPPEAKSYRWLYYVVTGNQT